MADTKITDLTELTAPATDDQLVMVDISDTSMAASGTDKRVEWTTLRAVTPFGTPRSFPYPLSSTPASSVTGVANTWYALLIVLMGSATITGIRYRVGATASGNVRSSLWNAAGTTQIADRTSDVAQGTAFQNQLVAFTTTTVQGPGIFLALLWFSSATATFMGARHLTLTSTGTNASNTPTSSIGAGAVENADRPIMATY